MASIAYAIERNMEVKYSFNPFSVRKHCAYNVWTSCQVRDCSHAAFQEILERQGILRLHSDNGQNIFVEIRAN